MSDNYKLSAYLNALTAIKSKNLLRALICAAKEYDISEHSSMMYTGAWYMDGQNNMLVTVLTKYFKIYDQTKAMYKTKRKTNDKNMLIHFVVRLYVIT